MIDINYLVAIISSFASLWKEAAKRSVSYKDDIKNKRTINELRYEWVACLLFLSCVKTFSNAENDADWLWNLYVDGVDEKKLLSNFDTFDSLSSLVELDYKKFPVAYFIAWVILSSHKIPVPFYNFKGSSLKDLNLLFDSDIVSTTGFNKGDFLFPEGLIENRSWAKEVRKWACTLIINSKGGNIIKDLIKHDAYCEIMLCSRLALKIAGGKKKSQSWNKYINFLFDIARDKLELFRCMPGCSDGKPCIEAVDPVGNISFKYNDGRRILAERFGKERNTIILNDSITPQKAEYYMRKFNLPEDEVSVMLDVKEGINGVYTSFAWNPVDLSPITDENKLNFIVPSSLIVSQDVMLHAYSIGDDSIIPLLRMMGSNLIFENFNKFTAEEFAVIKGLVYLSGVFGRKCSFSSVLLTSEEIAQLARSYDAGWKAFAYSRDLVSGTHLTLNNIKQTTQLSLRVNNKTLISNINKFYNKEKQNQKEEIKLFLNRIEPSFEAIGKDIIRCHEATSDTYFGKRISFGIIRFNNAEECINLNKYLANHYLGLEVKTLLYCNCENLWMKNEKEKYLKHLFYDKYFLEERFSDKIVHEHLEKSDDIAFVVVTDCDFECAFNWAIIEPNPSAEKMIANMTETWQLGEYLHVYNEEFDSCEPNTTLLLKSFDGRTLEDYKAQIDFRNLDSVIRMVHNSLGIFDKENEQKRLKSHFIRMRGLDWLSFSEEEALEEFTKSVRIKKEEVKKVF